MSNREERDDVRLCQVHAFIDGELEPMDREQIMQEMAEDPELRRQVCELRNLKAAVSHAYADIEPPETGRVLGGGLSRGLCQGVAALLLLAVGVLLGWKGHEQRLEHLLAGAVEIGDVKADPTHVVLHIDESNPDKFEEVLDRAVALVESYKARGVHVEVIANSGGLDLMRKDASPYAQRVSEIMRKYDNIDFIACANAIRRLERQGVHVQLIDRTHPAPSAVEHIVERLREGWTYIKV
ncbi:MAG: hypothetical protein D6717_07960 [Gammaproteobacteria bacterium]|nr:MAG: hypothetical protein D6717_07960 [Gammaproteobacteria bacterium]